MQTTLMRNEIGWAKVFLAFMKEAETEADQLRLRGMGIQWTANAAQHHGSDLMQYFQMLEGCQTAPTVPQAGLARAVGSKLIRGR
jgi:hypothetical protein